MQAAEQRARNRVGNTVSGNYYIEVTQSTQTLLALQKSWLRQRLEVIALGLCEKVCQEGPYVPSKTHIVKSKLAIRT